MKWDILKKYRHPIMGLTLLGMANNPFGIIKEAVAAPNDNNETYHVAQSDSSRVVLEDELSEIKARLNGIQTKVAENSDLIKKYHASGDGDDGNNPAQDKDLKTENPISNNIPFDPKRNYMLPFDVFSFDGNSDLLEKTKAKYGNNPTVSFVTTSDGQLTVDKRTIKMLKHPVDKYNFCVDFTPYVNGDSENTEGFSTNGGLTNPIFEMKNHQFKEGDFINGQYMKAQLEATYQDKTGHKESVEFPLIILNNGNVVYDSGDTDTDLQKEIDRRIDQKDKDIRERLDNLEDRLNDADDPSSDDEERPELSKKNGNGKIESKVKYEEPNTFSGHVGTGASLNQLEETSNQGSSIDSDTFGVMFEGGVANNNVDFNANLMGYADRIGENSRREIEDDGIRFEADGTAALSIINPLKLGLHARFEVDDYERKLTHIDPVSPSLNPGDFTSEHFTDIETDLYLVGILGSLDKNYIRAGVGIPIHTSFEDIGYELDPDTMFDEPSIHAGLQLKLLNNAGLTASYDKSVGQDTDAAGLRRSLEREDIDANLEFPIGRNLGLSLYGKYDDTKASGIFTDNNGNPVDLGVRSMEQTEGGLLIRYHFK